MSRIDTRHCAYHCYSQSGGLQLQLELSFFRGPHSVDLNRILTPCLTALAGLHVIRISMFDQDQLADGILVDGAIGLLDWACPHPLLLHSSKLNDPVRSSTVNSVLAMSHSNDFNGNYLRLRMWRIALFGLRGLI